MQKPSLQMVLIGIGLFFVFLLVSFPYQNLKGYLFGKIYSQTGIYISAKSISPTFLGWPGLIAENATITVPLHENEISIESNELVVRVVPAGIFPPRLGISIKFIEMKKGGTLYVKFSHSGSSMAGKFWTQNLDLRQVLPSNLTDTFTGKINGEGDFDLSLNQLSKSNGQIKLEGDHLKIASQNLQGFFLPPVNLGPLKTRINIKNGTVEPTQFQLGDSKSDIQGSILGEVKIATDLMASLANITLKVSPSETFRKDPRATSILAFLDGYYKSSKNDSYTMKWNGTLEEITTRSPLPQKVAD